MADGRFAKGYCVYCKATAKLTPGQSGEPGELTWSNGAVEIWSCGSNSSICPLCWAKVKDERRERMEAFNKRGKKS